MEEGKQASDGIFSNVVGHATPLLRGMPSGAHFIAIDPTAERKEDEVALVR